jgi:alpha-L-fucosidase 2
MRQPRREFLKTVALGTSAAFGGADAPDPLVLWYRRPAQQWMEALPVGNGFLGAMVFGSVEKERIQHNLWSGHANNEQNPQALESLPRIRQLLFDGKYAEAEEMARKI